MKFMDEVETRVGQGAFLGHMKDGRILATIAKEKVRGRVCHGPCLNVVVRRCDRKGIWCEGKGCEECNEIAAESNNTEIAAESTRLCKVRSQ